MTRKEGRGREVRNEMKKREEREGNNIEWPNNTPRSEI